MWGLYTTYDHRTDCKNINKEKSHIERLYMKGCQIISNKGFSLCQFVDIIPIPRNIEKYLNESIQLEINI